MRKMGFKGRCTKKALSKSKEICRTYDPIQGKYAEKLEESPEIQEIRCNVLMEGLEEGEYVPRKLHKAIDSIQEIAVKRNGNWIKMDFVSAAEYYGISPYEFLEAFANEKYKIPNKIWGKYQYYSKSVNSENGQEVVIDIRIIRQSDTK